MTSRSCWRTGIGGRLRLQPICDRRHCTDSGCFLLTDGFALGSRGGNGALHVGAIGSNEWLGLVCKLP